MGTPEFRFLIQIFRYHRLDLAYSTVASYAKYSEYLLSSLHSLLVLYGTGVLYTRCAHYCLQGELYATRD